MKERKRFFSIDVFPYWNDLYVGTGLESLTYLILRALLQRCQQTNLVTPLLHFNTLTIVAGEFTILPASSQLQLKIAFR